MYLDASMGEGREAAALLQSLLETAAYEREELLLPDPPTAVLSSSLGLQQLEKTAIQMQIHTLHLTRVVSIHLCAAKSQTKTI